MVLSRFFPLQLACWQEMFHGPSHKALRWRLGEVVGGADGPARLAATLAQSRAPGLTSQP
jgi:hypothetical protein